MAKLSSIRIGPIEIIVVDADPNGSILATKGSIAIWRKNGAIWYQNQDGTNTGWMRIN